MKTTVREFLQANLDETNVALEELVRQREAIKKPIYRSTRPIWEQLSQRIRPLQSRRRELEKRLKELL